MKPTYEVTRDYDGRYTVYITVGDTMLSVIVPKGHSSYDCQISWSEGDGWNEFEEPEYGYLGDC